MAFFFRRACVAATAITFRLWRSPIASTTTDSSVFPGDIAQSLQIQSTVARSERQKRLHREFAEEVQTSVEAWEYNENTNLTSSWKSPEWKAHAHQEFYDCILYCRKKKIKDHWPLRSEVLASYYRWLYTDCPYRPGCRKTKGRTIATVEHAMGGIAAVHYHAGLANPNSHPLVTSAHNDIKDLARENPLDKADSAEPYTDEEFLKLGDIALRAGSIGDKYLVRKWLWTLWGSNCVCRGYGPLAYAILADCRLENIPNADGELEQCFTWQEKMFKSGKCYKKRKRIIRPNPVPALNFLLHFGLFCVLWDITPETRGYVFRTDSGDGFQPISYQTMRKDGDRFEKYGIKDKKLLEKLKRLHATRVFGIVKVFNGGGTLAEGAWAGGWCDVKMAIVYALKALESGGRQIGRDSSAFFNDPYKSLSASANHTLMTQNKTLQEQNEQKDREIRDLKVKEKNLRRIIYGRDQTIKSREAEIAHLKSILAEKGIVLDKDGIPI